MTQAHKKNGYKIAFKIAYDGTPFSGWQVQVNEKTIQGTIENAICRITQENVRLVGAGRTDASVHAKGQVAHAIFTKPHDPSMLKKALNAVLESAIRIVDVIPASDDFHAQYSCVGKEYHYYLCTTDVVLPFDRPYVWHYRKTIDLSLLKKASMLFLGEHDFRAFSNSLGRGVIKENTVRTIYNIQCTQTSNGLCLSFIGSGFLYKMVRNITGTLLNVASCQMDIATIEDIFASKDRKKTPQGAPPQGLFLMHCFYDEKSLKEKLEKVL